MPSLLIILYNQSTNGGNSTQSKMKRMERKIHIKKNLKYLSRLRQHFSTWGHTYTPVGPHNYLKGSDQGQIRSMWGLSKQTRRPLLEKGCETLGNQFTFFC